MLAHSRDEHVSQVLKSLTRARGIEDHELIAVLDGKWPKTLGAINALVNPAIMIEAVHAEGLFPRARILKNLQVGLTLAFDVFDAPYCVVIEDDIVVSEDFLEFVKSAYTLSKKDPLFRAINGFSVLQPSAEHPVGAYLRLNYGVGCGWALPRSTYRKIEHLFSWDGDYHWDGLIEPCIRTGYVINPIRSRVLNIGFDGSGAHSGSEADQQLGREMQTSLLQENEWSSTPQNLQKASLPFGWRQDAISLDSLSPMSRIAVYLVGRALWTLTLIHHWLDQRKSLLIAPRVRAMKKLITRRTLPHLGSLSRRAARVPRRSTLWLRDRRPEKG